MRKVVPVLVLSVGLLFSAATADAAGNVQFMIGQRYLDSAVWAPVERPQMFGFQVDFAPSESPVHVALGSSLATHHRPTLP